MGNFKIERIFIGDKVIDRLTDENGVEWYPFRRFLQGILCKYDKISKFRDSEMIKHLQVIAYPINKKAPNRDVKTWCVNTKGIRYLLRRMNILQRGNTNIALYRAREKGFYEACLHFKVRPLEKLDPLYINTPPKLDEYDIWSVTCIENDLKLRANDRWKKCNGCDYYYPDKARYFGSDRKKNKKCLQCQGKDFQCQNKILQFIYDNNGIDLIYKISLNDNDSIVNALRTFIGHGGIKCE